MLEHGGNLQQAATQYGIALDSWLDLSTGINPHGYPVSEIPTAIWQRLPLADDALQQAAIDYYQAKNVLITAGSQAAIQALPRLRQPTCHIAMPAMMYAEHAKNWSQSQHRITTFSGAPDDGLLASVDVLLICNPNNPTASLIETSTLLAWHAKLAQRGGWLIVDEAFMDTTPEHSLARHLPLPGLIILRSLGKFFGLAGARTGFVLAEPVLLNTLEEMLGPWPVSGPARFVALRALQDQAWQTGTQHKLRTDSQHLNALLSHNGLTPQGSHALFQWVPTPKAVEWHHHLAQHGILVRLFKAWSALRFGLPPTDGWERLEAALKTFKG